MKVKVFHNNDIRVWRHEESPTCDGLHAFITNTWNMNCSSYIAQYEDEEHDLMTIATSHDLNDAFDFAQSQHKKSLKIYIRHVVPSKEHDTKKEAKLVSFGEMLLDFLKNEEIKTVLPQFFTTLVENIRLSNCAHFCYNKQYAKYVKMRKIQMPAQSIRNKMKFDGFTQKEIDFFMQNVADTRYLRKYHKFIQWKAMKMPSIAIRHGMKKDGCTESEINAFVNGKSHVRHQSLKAITNAIYALLKKEPYSMITKHIFYVQNASTTIAYIAQKVYDTQGIYSHFASHSIQKWVRQMIDALYQNIAQNKGCDSFKDINFEIVLPVSTDFGETIHFDTECNECECYPIIGDRYKCALCFDHDLCAVCAANGKHGDHPVIKFRKTLQYHKHAVFNGLDQVVGSLCGSKKQQEMKSKCVKCVCGEAMRYVTGKDAYNWTEWVYCDRCKAKFLNEKVYNCPKGRDKVYHKNGYDLCVNCALFSE